MAIKNIGKNKNRLKSGLYSAEIKSTFNLKVLLKVIGYLSPSVSKANTHTSLDLKYFSTRGVRVSPLP